MRRISFPAVVSMVLTMLIGFLTAVPANAQGFASKITIDVAPEYLFGTNGDQYAPPPPGFGAVGYSGQKPQVPNEFNVDYGLDYNFAKNFHLVYSHGNVAYGLGRILTVVPGSSFLSGSLFDYTDTVALTYGVGHGVTIIGSYFNHQRQNATGECLNQRYCVSPNGGVASNPVSIDEMGYTLGFSADVGPNTKIGKLFNFAGSAKYIPRPSTPATPTVALGGLGAYKGSQVLYPYSGTLRIPIFPSTKFIPFINYTHLPVLYRDSAVPEDYRGWVWGFSQIVTKNITFSYTNLNLQTCRCIARVPPPDNLRLAFGILKLDFHTPL